MSSMICPDCNETLVIENECICGWVATQAALEEKSKKKEDDDIMLEKYNYAGILNRIRFFEEIRDQNEQTDLMKDSLNCSIDNLKRSMKTIREKYSKTHDEMMTPCDAYRCVYERDKQRCKNRRALSQRTLIEKELQYCELHKNLEHY